MVTDPIADFLVRLQNAFNVEQTHVSVPSSKVIQALAEVLKREGYISNAVYHKNDNTLVVELAYKNGRPSIAGTKRISKPSRRMYQGVRDIKPVKHGHGLLVLSTPAGILTGKEALQKRVGGEALFEIW